ncbi:hypothetical protein KUTeg_021511 [Tegillarca granosa]|uniref:PIPK domain-containing protein n=1 Tax=Tegillarca granosa TaxID=220873 RepID=A0ABQ9E3Y9_TEGGR|nr:hypothetical protein KUTeg_021511 [Tegillarca granosa]
MSFLSEYLEHFQTYPHSLIVKFLGLYSVEILGKSNTKPPEKGKPVLTAMKDVNFLDEVIELGHQKNWFIKQLKLDVKFLETLGVQDYSLLVGRHPLHENERHQSFGSLVMRMTKCVYKYMCMSSNVKKKLEGKEFKTISKSLHLLFCIAYRSFSNKDDIDLSSSVGKNSLYIPEDLSEEESKPDMAENVGKVYFENPSKPKTFFFHSLVHLRDIDDGKNTANRRLLPHCKNPLHVIDGVHYRYFLGIIDFFTQFESRQRVVKILKDIRYCCGEHSTVPAEVYADRFLHFITERTE